MRRIAAPLVALTALAVAGCGGTNTNIRTGEGMVNPDTGVLDPRFIDGTFQLSAVIEERIGGPLNNSDRREIDNAVDLALASAPAAPPQIWRNELRNTDGYVDLASWRVDARAGELCGIIQHESRFNEILTGAVTICRASIDPAWRVDEVVWAEPVAEYVPPTTGKPRPPRTKPRPPVVAKPTPPVNYGPGPAPTPQPQPQPQPPVNYGPGTGGGGGGGGTPGGGVPVTGGGATTLGDVLASPQ